MRQRPTALARATTRRPTLTPQPPTQLAPLPDAETAVDASETVGDPSAGDTPNNIVNTENSASDQAKAA